MNVLEMTRIRPYLLGIILCLPMAAGGCSRTDDGTVVIPPSMDMRRAWLRDEPSVQTPPVESGTEVFPVSPTVEPAIAQRPVIERKKQRRPARPASASRRNAQPVPQVSAPIACGEAKQADGRVHVTCKQVAGYRHWPEQLNDRHAANTVALFQTWPAEFATALEETYRQKTPWMGRSLGDHVAMHIALSNEEVRGVHGNCSLFAAASDYEGFGLV